MRLRAYLALSLDGYVATPDGGVAWLDPFNTEDYGYDAFLAEIGTVISGRTTFDQALELNQGASPYAAQDVYVLTSRELPDRPPRTTAWNDGAAQLIAHLRQQQLDQDVWVLGGPATIHRLREVDVIDTYELYVMPILLGDGIPMFGRYDQASPLRLVRQRAFANGALELIYEPVRTKVSS